MPHNEAATCLISIMVAHRDYTTDQYLHDLLASLTHSASKSDRSRAEPVDKSI